MSKPLEVLVGEILSKHGLQLAVAESCTGGLIGHRLTEVPGSSAYFRGGVIAYANDIKHGLLNVNLATLEDYGAVSQETVLEMATGARAALQADVALSVSGIAGPGGGTPAKPVGSVWIGLDAPGYLDAWLHRFSGNRSHVKSSAAEAALQHLVDVLEEHYG